MKTKTLLFAFFAAVAFNLNAQDGNVQKDYSHYLDKAMEKLDNGDCSAAQKLYNVYKELSKDPILSFEDLIEDCRSNDTVTKYAVGDKIKIKKDIYTVVHVEDGGKHGFAVCEYGSGTFDEKWNSDRLIPTSTEFSIMIENKIKLHGRYWSTNVSSSGKDVWCYGFGEFEGEWINKNETSGILFIYRF